MKIIYNYIAKTKEEFAFLEDAYKKFSEHYYLEMEVGELNVSKPPLSGQAKFVDITPVGINNKLVGIATAPEKLEGLLVKEKFGSFTEIALGNIRYFINHKSKNG